MNSLGPWEDKMKNLSNEQSATPPGIVWDNVELAIKKDKRRRLLFIPFMLVSLLALGALSINYFNSDGTISKDKNSSLVDSVLKSKPDITTTTSSAVLEKSNTEVNSNRHDNASNESIGLEKKRLNSSARGRTVKSSNASGKNAGSGTPGLQQNNANNQLSEETLQTPKEVIESKEVISAQRSSANLQEFNRLPLLIKPVVRKQANLTPLKPGQDDCPKFNKKKEINFFVEAEGSIGKPSKSMEDNPDYSGLYKYRLNSEDPWYNWGFGIHAGLIFNHTWSLSTGVDFSQVKEKFTTTRPGYTVVIIHKDPNGVPIDTVVQTGTLINSAENRHTLLDIPITVGYEHRMDNWSFGLEAGLNINMSLKSRGKIFNGSQSILKLEDQDDIYKSSLGLGAHVSFVVQRYLSDNTSIYLKPGFKTYFGDWTVEDYPLKTSYNLFMLNLGIRHSF